MKSLNGYRLTLLGVCLLIVHLVVAPSILAQAQPPDRFYGKASVDGKDQGEGTVVEAYVGNTLCGSGTVQNRNGDTIYLVDVLGAGQKPNCAGDGDTVKFRIAGLDAKESGTYQTAAATRLDLTAAGTPRQVSQPTVLPPGGGGTPAAPPSFTPAVPPLTPAPTAVPVIPTPAAAATPVVSGTPAAAETPAAATETATPPAASPTASALATAKPSATPAVARPNNGNSGGVSWPLRIIAFLAFAGIVFGAVAWYRRRGG